MGSKERTGDADTGKASCPAVGAAATARRGASGQEVGVRPAPFVTPCAAASLPRGRSTGRKSKGGCNPQVDTRRVLRKAYSATIPVLFLIAALNYIDRASVSYAALQFKPQLGISAWQYGLGTGLFYLGYAVFMVPTNALITRVGAAPVLAALVAAWGLVAACTAAMSSLPHFLALRFFLGVAESGSFCGSYFHLMQFFTSWEIGFAYACVTSATALSGVVGAPLAAGLLYMDGLGGLRGWQWVFLLEGCTTALYGLCLKWLLAERPGTAYFLKPPERRWLQDRQDRLAANAEATHAAEGRWWAGFVDWRIYYFGSCFGILHFGVAAVLYFSPFLISAVFFSGDFSGRPKDVSLQSEHEQAWHSARVALISTTLWLPVGLAIICVSWSCMRFSERRFHCFIPALVAGVSFLLVPLGVAHSPVGGYILLILAASGVFAVLGPMYSWLKTFLHGDGIALGVALFNALGAVGGFSGSVVMGALVDASGYRTCMYLLGGLFLLQAAAMFVFRPKTIEGGIVFQDGGEVVIPHNPRGVRPSPEEGDTPAQRRCPGV